MIRSIWLRIAALILLAVLPATLLQLKLQGESVRLVFDVADRTAVRPTIDLFLTTLKEHAQLLPERADQLKARFEEVLGTKRALEGFFMARDSIAGEIREQTLLITGATLFISLLLSLWISWGIVREVQGLMLEREKAAAKLRDLKALQHWQMSARTLVHELKAPVTPIKLIASDIEHKYQSLNGDAFGQYISQAGSMISEQVAAIEAMIGCFTAFGRLPPPEPKAQDFTKFISDFALSYAGSFGENVAIQAPGGSARLWVAFDAKLLRDLLFNLVKNAAEANDGVTQITLHTTIEQGLAILLVHNTGQPIAAELGASVFEPYVSAKKGAGRSNMGLGLTIARKIALDHGGDLRLDESTSQQGVTFRLELLLCPTPKEGEK